MKTKDIVIIGARGLAAEVAFLINEINIQNTKWNLIGFIDNNKTNIGQKINNVPVIGTDDWLIGQKKKINVVFGIGNPDLIKKISLLYNKHDFFEFPNLIHPNVIGDWENISIGVGNIIFAGNVLTTSIKIGNFNYFNMSCTLGHDITIGNYNVINPMVSISGGVKLGNQILLGTGSRILQYNNVCSDCIIGAGSVVTSSLLKPATYIGAPARPLFKK